MQTSNFCYTQNYWLLIPASMIASRGACDFYHMRIWRYVSGLMRLHSNSLVIPSLKRLYRNMKWMQRLSAS